jgi:hypothetical protein
MCVCSTLEHILKKRKSFTVTMTRRRSDQTVLSNSNIKTFTVTMTRRRSDQTVLSNSKIKTEGLSSTKREAFAEECPEPKKAKKTSHRLIHQPWNKGLDKSDEKPPEPAVKHEEVLSPAEHETKSLGAKIPVNEGQKYREREDIGSFKTLENGLIYFFRRS